MTTWDDLVSVALVGTERRPVPEPVMAGVAAVLGADLPPAPPELAILTASGVLAAYRRTGWTPPHHDDAPPQPAPPDDRRLPSPAATQLLELLLTGQVDVYGGAGFLAADWLDRCAASGHRLPDRLLPGMLDAATRDRSLRAGTVAAGGPRLRWLAGRNPAWAWAVAAPDSVAAPGSDCDAATRWSTAGRDTRLRLFTSLRATRPDAARRLAEDTWAGENAKDRAAILAAMAVGLGPEDEPFLEAALDDRAKGVRREAADLLAALPSSRLAARMADRLRPLVVAGAHLRNKLEIAPPAEPDAAARRDGIIDDGRPDEIGLRGWWLVQIIAATPLGFWPNHTGLDPATIAGLTETQVRQGLVQAARRQRDAEWAAALLPHRRDPALFAVLRPAEADAALVTWVKAVPDTQLAALLGATPRPWSLATSRAVLERLRRAKTAGPLRHALDVLATGLHPSAAPGVERWAQILQEDDYTRRIVRSLAHALSIRRTIAQEFT